MNEESGWKNRVRERRLLALVATETELAKSVGLSRSTISRIENQKVFLTSRNALKIAEALNCTLNDLYVEDDKEGENGDA